MRGMDALAHKTHSWSQEAVFLNPGPRTRITGACVVWTCRCGAATEKDYTFRKPSGKEGIRKPSEDDRYAKLIRSEGSKWPTK